MKMDTEGEMPDLDDGGTVTGENAELAALWKAYWGERDRGARNDLLLAYEPIVQVVLARLPSSLRAHWEFEDLRSFGLLGLVEAIGRFEQGSIIARFPSYARARVRGAIFDELRRLDWLPRAVRRRVIAYRSAVDVLSASLGRAPGANEVLREMGVADRDASSVLQAVQSSQLVHLQQESQHESGGEAGTLIDLIAADRDEEPEEKLLLAERLDEVRTAITRLPERHRTVISLHYFGGLNQSQIGAMLGVTNSRICQIEGEALQALRRAVEGARPRPARVSQAS